MYEKDLLTLKFYKKERFLLKKKKNKIKKCGPVFIMNSYF